MNRQHFLGVLSVKTFRTLQRVSFDDLLIDDNSISKSDFLRSRSINRYLMNL